MMLRAWVIVDVWITNFRFNMFTNNIYVQIIMVMRQVIMFLKSLTRFITTLRACCSTVHEREKRIICISNCYNKYVQIKWFTKIKEKIMINVFALKFVNLLYERSLWMPQNDYRKHKEVECFLNVVDRSCMISKTKRNFMYPITEHDLWTKCGFRHLKVKELKRRQAKVKS